MVFHLGVNVLLLQGPTQKVCPANKTIRENKRVLFEISSAVRTITI